MSRAVNPEQDLFNLLDAQADDIMSLTDEEIHREVREDGLDPDVEAERLRVEITKMVAAAGRTKLAAARAVLDARKGGVTSNVLNLPIDRKQQIVESFAANDSHLRTRVTMAARQGEGASEREVDSILQDLHDLGAIDDEGNPI